MILKRSLAALALITVVSPAALAATPTSLNEVVAREANIPEEQASAEVERVFDGISAALREGQEVRVRSFGTFYVQSREARKGRNPRTGEEIEIPAKKYPRFRSSDVLKRNLNLTGE